MDIKDFRERWNKVISIYGEDRADGRITPQQTAERIILNIGLTNAKECFATVARLKAHDGRIYGANREWSKSYKVNTDILSREARWMLPDLDAIHTTHIDQIMTYIRNA